MKSEMNEAQASTFLTNPRVVLGKHYLYLHVHFYCALSLSCIQDFWEQLLLIIQIPLVL